MTNPRFGLNEKVTVTIVRREASFDRACDEAYERAASDFGVDEDDHITNVRDSDRAIDAVVVEFQTYRHHTGMAGHRHVYHFVAWVARSLDWMIQ